MATGYVCKGMKIGCFLSFLLSCLLPGTVISLRAQSPVLLEHGFVTGVRVDAEGFDFQGHDLFVVPELGYYGRYRLNDQLALRVDARLFHVRRRSVYDRQYNIVTLRPPLTTTIAGDSGVQLTGTKRIQATGLSIPITLEWQPLRDLPLALLTGWEQAYSFSSRIEYRITEREFDLFTGETVRVTPGVVRRDALFSRSYYHLPAGISYATARWRFELHLATGRWRVKSNRGRIYRDSFALSARYRL